jgi:hypothetical protein
MVGLSRRMMGSFSLLMRGLRTLVQPLCPLLSTTWSSSRSREMTRIQRHRGMPTG